MKQNIVLKQTAGRMQLGEFAPKFAELNDDILFGQVWSREDKLSLRDRSLVTVTALMIFPIGQPNDAFAKYFIGQSYLAPLSTQQV